MFNYNVKICTDSIIQDYVEIGSYPEKAEEVSIGHNSVIRSHTVIYGGNKIGNRFQTGHGVLIRENNIIGDNVSVGSHSVVERENTIGNNVRIHSNCFIPEFVIIEDDVWIGPSTTILNVLHPPCPRFEDCAKSVRLCKGAKIGGHVTIGPRVTIGENSLIGMGSVVTKDIPANVLAYGNPARVICYLDKMKCEAGYFETPYEWIE
ncbi:DapH/DapD/GlmU-related protein [uncultured Methanolobus sp.]|uniref:acyltransferase n=1 Tax=uncultured Methanolobus sp. TaxID=218300 RepID=UPI002AAAD564|nr:DapH/DapD/GlmU-related protein [uncultured Methanolobus sp.]